MALADELLDSISEEQFAEYMLVEENPHIVIDEDRNIILPERYKIIAAQGDHDMATYTFDCPRFSDGRDMSKMVVYINYIRSDGETGSYPADNVSIDAQDNDLMHFEWTPLLPATLEHGAFAFLVCVCRAEPDGSIKNHWSTRLCKDATISEGMDCHKDTIINMYPDVITRILERLNVLEDGVTTSVQYTVQDLEEEQKVQARKNIEAADAKEVSKLSEEIANVGKPTDEQVKSAVNDYLDENGVVLPTTVEPEDDDIPKVFFSEAIPQTKDDAVTALRYISKTQDISGYAEFKAQGNSSMGHPKKNMTVKMYSDEALTEKLKVNFKEWGEQAKHVYKANWIDLPHARNIVSARLWADVVKSRSNYMELPELYRTSPNQGAVDGFPVKVYSQGIYQGRYTLNIPKDAWMANMNDSLDEHCILCGENYVSGCFRALANIDGNDWTDEVHDIVPDSIKTRWNEIISFVMNSTDEDFKANLGNYFFVDSLIDYFIFGVVSCGLDAFGKNQLYFTYDGLKWIAGMYDMDSTWGLWWNGSKFVASDYARTSFQDFADGQGNLLYVRLLNLFMNEIKERWDELKIGALSIPNIINHFERFTDIAPLELVKEDYATTTGSGKFTGIPLKETNNIQQIRQYIIDRYAYCETYFASLVELIPCTGISLNTTTLTFTAEGSQTLTATVTPDGCTDAIVWTSSNASIATVKDGVVTAIANGSATITATCGSYSASCNVSVSGLYEPVACTGITLDKTELSFTETGSQTLTATVTPTDTTDSIVWDSDNKNVATVENGVVTVIASGSAIITATCGNYSASCTVSAVLPIDYTLDAFANVTWTDNYKYAETTGDAVSFNGCYMTDKFALQDCLYKLSGSGISDNRILVWDSNDNFVGCLGKINNGFVAKSGYKYAFWFWSGSSAVDKSTIKLMPTEVIGATVSIDLGSLTWGENATYSVATANISSYGLALNNIGSASHILCLSWTGTVSNVGEDVLFMLLDKNTLVTAQFATGEEATAYFAENPTTLIIN